MILCCGEGLIDMVRTSVPGSGNGFLFMPGGCAYNTSVAIGRLGTPVKYIGKISNDFFGDILLGRLKDNNVGDDLVVRTGLNTTLAIIDAGEEMPRYAFYTEGTSVPLFTEADLPSALPAGTSCIVFGSISMNMEPLAATVESFIGRYQSETDPVIAFDPNIRTFMINDLKVYAQRFEKWIAASTIVKISSEDYAIVYPDLDPQQALGKFIAMGPRLAICTLGSDGALAYLRRNDGSIVKVSAPAVKTQIIDTVGAGDTFHGAFLSRLESRGKLSRAALAELSETDLYDALFFANKAASIVCSRHGSDSPALEEVENYPAKGL